VYSEPGNGTTFKVFLPISFGRSQPAIEPGPPLEIRGEGTILVVDDEAVIQRTIRAALERYGYTVISAGGGAEATQILEEMGSRILLVLLDMTMPVVSGEETLRRLRTVRSDV